MEKPPVIRKRRHLEMFLEKVPGFTAPDPRLEQYKTPAPVAADILFFALNSGDISQKHIVDLGCGTGIFAAGAAVLGASKVSALDSDSAPLQKAREFSGEFKLDIDFQEMDVSECNWSCDTVIMNPPFGAQTRRADRVFLEIGAMVGNVVYSIHNSNTTEFVGLLIKKLGCIVTVQKNYIFKIGHTFDFHSKAVKEIEVTLFRFEHVNNRT